MFSRDDWIQQAKLSPVALDKWQTSTDLLARLFKASSCCIVQQSPIGFQFEVTSLQPNELFQPGGIIPVSTRSLHSLVLEAHKGLYIPDTSDQPDWQACCEVEINEVRSYLGIPLRWPNGHPFGILAIMDTQPTDYRDTYLELAENIRQQIQTDLLLLVTEEEISELNIRDEMTGIYNRKGFNTLAQHKLSVAKRYGHNFGLMYFDLDNLGLINEQLGWETGNQVVQTLASALDSELRDSDIAARLGEDDFAALVFIREHDDLENLATRIQRKLNILKQRSDRMPPITTSVGARWYEADKDLDIDETLEDVDRLMFAIKQEKKQSPPSGNLPKH